MKRYLQLSLVILFPYLVIFALVCIFKGYFMETVFQNNGFNVLFALLALYVVALISSIVMPTVCIVKQHNSQEILKANMIIKSIHIPAYIIMFILGLLLLITIFTFAISIALMVFDCMTIVLTGIIGTSGIIRGVMEKKLSLKTAILHAILQFIFCADIISSIIVYIKVKNANKRIQE